MYAKLKNFVSKPNRAAVKRTMPKCFERYGGRASDGYITQTSGFLDTLRPAVTFQF